MKKLGMLHVSLIVAVGALFIGTLPMWPYSSEWGYYPSGSLGVMLAIMLALIELGYM